MARAHFNARILLACGLVALDAVAASLSDAPDPDFLEYLAQHDEPGVLLPDTHEPDSASSSEPARSATSVVIKP